MIKLTIKHMLTLGALALAAGAHSAPATTPAALTLSSREGAVTRTLALQNWRTDKRGVPSFDYHYRQSGPGCDYQRDGRAVAGFEENGGKVELEVFNPEGADGKESAPIAVYYDADSSVIFSMPVAGKSRRVWVSFEDAVLKKTLPKKCGHAGRGDAVMFRQ
jgi:hypothetical protein